MSEYRQGLPELELSVAIVLFQPDLRILEATVRSLTHAVRQAGLQARASLTLIDHSPGAGGGARLASRARSWTDLPVEMVSDRSNPGFGRGHNRMLGTLGRYHLVLNPDVELAADALLEAVAFLDAHPQCGLISPGVFGENGQRQFLCKRYPTILDLLLRGFAPAALLGRFSTRLDRYEMRDVVAERVVWDPPIVSGCFMLFRSSVLQTLGGFDPRFFLYFEDFDLSIRTARVTRIAYVPNVRIVHHGGHAARKGLRHIWLFGRSAFSFFSKHRWAWF